MFWCVVLLRIFVSCVVFWQAFKVSRNTNNVYRNTKWYYTPKCPISYLLSNSFFWYQVSLLVSHKAGKVKQLEKYSICSWLVNQVFFTLQNNQLYNFARYLYSIQESFVLYFVQLDNNSLIFIKHKPCFIQLTWVTPQ